MTIPLRTAEAAAMVSLPTCDATIEQVPAATARSFPATIEQAGEVVEKVIGVKPSDEVATKV